MCSSNGAERRPGERSSLSSSKISSAGCQQPKLCSYSLFLVTATLSIPLLPLDESAVTSRDSTHPSPRDMPDLLVSRAWISSQSYTTSTFVAFRVPFSRPRVFNSGSLILLQKNTAFPSGFDFITFLSQQGIIAASLRPLRLVGVYWVWHILGSRKSCGFVSVPLH